MRNLYNRSQLAKDGPDALQGVDTSGARALMELSRDIFRKSHNSQTLTRLMDLESLVLSTTAFAVTESRDVIYALLYLASDITFESSLTKSPSSKTFLFTTDYSRHPVDIFLDFVQYCIQKSKSLNIICRHWAIWPRPKPETPFEGRKLPSWIGVASFARQKFASRTKQPVRRDNSSARPKTQSMLRLVEMTSSGRERKTFFKCLA